MKYSRLVVICWIVGIGTLASAQIALRLESDTREKVSGLPVPLRLVAVNTGSTDARLPPSVYIHASRDSQESFVGHEITPWDNVPVGDEDLLPEWEPRPALAPGATAVGDLPISPTCEGPYSLMHPFTWPAGRYTLRALVPPGPGQMTDPFHRNYTLQEVVAAVPGLTISSPLVIDVREPEGVDAEAWNFVLTKTAGEGWLRMYGRNPMAIARELRQRFPTSQYTYFFGATFLHEETLATLEAIAAQLRAATPRPPTLDWVELTIAGNHDSQCTRHYLRTPPEVESAIAECDTARALYQRIIDTAMNPAVRFKATENMTRVMDAEQIRNVVLRHAAADAGTYQKVVPLLQCVKETGARLEARFGYRNPNPFIVYNPAGHGNLFASDPQDRGQPTKFLPGLHEAS